MSKEDVINYVMTTPGNPNRAVLSGMLDSIADASSGGVFIVKMTPSGTAPNITLTPNKPFEDALGAYNSGALVVAVIESINYGAFGASVSIPLAYNDYMFDKLEGNAIVTKGNSSSEGQANAMRLRWYSSSVDAAFYSV